MTAPPGLVVEIGFDGDYTTPPTVWTDVTEFVSMRSALQIAHGRQDEFTIADPNELRLLLDNSDGRFTPEDVSSPHFPDVRIGRPIRARLPGTGPGSPSTRYDGFIDQWPLEWPEVVGSFATTNLAAASRMSRLGLDDPLPSLPTLVLASGDLPHDRYDPFSRHPFRGWRVVGTGDDVEFTEPNNALTDGLATPLFKGDRYFESSGRYEPDRTIGMTISCGNAGGYFFGKLKSAPEGSASVADAFLVQVVPDDGRLFVTNAVGGAIDTEVGTRRINDNQPHSVVLFFDEATNDVDIYVDGALDLELSSTGVAFEASSVSIGGATNVDNLPTSPSFTGRVSRLVGYDTEVASGNPADDWATEYDDAFRAGFDGEAPGDRLARYAGYGGVALTSFASGSTPIAHIDTTGATPLELMRKVEKADGGVLFDAPDGTLTYQGRGHRYNAASALTLDVAANEVAAGYAPQVDRSTLINEASYGGADGYDFTYKDTASVDEYGSHSDRSALATNSHVEVEAAAMWTVNANSDPNKARVPTLTVYLNRADVARQDELLALGIGDRITVTNLPSQAPSSTGDFFIEGYTEERGQVLHTITFNLSPAAPYRHIFRLDDTALGRLDAGNKLGR